MHNLSPLRSDLLCNSLTQQTIWTTKVFLALSSAGDEGSSRPVSPPRPTQLPPRPPLADAAVLAGRSRGQAGVRNPPVLSGSAHPASRLPQDGAEQVGGRKHIRDLSADDGDFYFPGFTPASFTRPFAEAALSRCSAPPPQTCQRCPRSTSG